jgi:hypothetical protein
MLTQQQMEWLVGEALVRVLQTLKHDKRIRSNYCISYPPEDAQG